MARPVRSGRPRSLTTPLKTFTYDYRSRDTVEDTLSPFSPAESSDERNRETVADVLAHLIPAETSSPAIDEEPIVVVNNDEEPGPRGSPLTPVASPQISFVGDDATAGAEVSPIEHNFHQQRPAIGRKRKANDAIPVTPPRRMRQKTSTVATTPTSNGNAPAADLMANLGENVRTWPTSVDHYLEQEPLADHFPRDPFTNVFKIAEVDKTQAKNSINKILNVASKLLKSQRELIHKYDTFELNTYKPMGRLGKGTEQLRDFTGRLRCDLEDMEKYMGQLADL